MARRKKTKSKRKRISFKPKPSRKKKARVNIKLPSLMVILKILAVVCSLAVLAVGFLYLDRYVKKTTKVSEKKAVFRLLDAPDWVTDGLKQRIYTAARASGDDLKLNEDAARIVQQSIAKQIQWLKDVRVQTTHEDLVIKGTWRKPIAMVKSGLHEFYVDAELAVLDFVPMTNLPIVQINGLRGFTTTPDASKIRHRDDLAAAVNILVRLARMDQSVTPEKPLLNEIDSIDVGNFNGRQNDTDPHIVLYTTDETEIIWGAEIGAWQRHLEATDEEKLAKLYSYYKEYGTLLGGARYINLRDPQDNVPLPIDKY